ncbi:MAG: tRNA uridine-5-carboxymethylaminomethyl(34) synthesis enzyme MnmG [Solirubrobacterales bacterium]
MVYEGGRYEVIVIGAGHAGCEAALAAARIGCATLLVTLSIDNIALMPCNPAIGGPAKAQLVREIDALGGEMALNIDKTAIQVRMLNTGKGPAVQALRAQADKAEYQREMTRTMLKEPKLDLLQAEVEAIEADQGKISAIRTRTGARFRTSALIVTTGTYLQSRIIVGDVTYEGGPNGQFAARSLSGALDELGLKLGRFKTGTPPRIDAKSLDYSKLMEQPGDAENHNFSWMSPPVIRSQISCWLTHSNQHTHEIIRENLHRSPLYSGVIKGVGPRHCPSFEDKVVRFPDKVSHQVFLEPEGRATDEMYVQGLNTSLPEDVQVQVLRSMSGLERVKMIRTGYAIEYDYVVPSQLKLSLESKQVPGLFTAGQINGTSGYEEAAAQGIIAGMNAALYVKEADAFILKRSDAYIGVLIDDLVSKGIQEPYRLMTSAAEYRLVLRQDNADQRLTERAHGIGLATDQRMKRLEQKRVDMNALENELDTVSLLWNDERLELLQMKPGVEIKGRVSAGQLMLRPEIRITELVDAGILSDSYSLEVLRQVETERRYEGYIRKQMEQISRFEAAEKKRLAEELDYDAVVGLSTEGRLKLKAVRPESIGQASRITGITPADISVLLVYLDKMKRAGER